MKMTSYGNGKAVTSDNLHLALALSPTPDTVAIRVFNNIAHISYIEFIQMANEIIRMKEEYDGTAP